LHFAAIFAVTLQTNSSACLALLKIVISCVVMSPRSSVRGDGLGRRVKTTTR